MHGLRHFVVKKYVYSFAELWRELILSCQSIEDGNLAQKNSAHEARLHEEKLQFYIYSITISQTFYLSGTEYHTFQLGPKIWYFLIIVRDEGSPTHEVDT